MAAAISNTALRCCVCGCGGTNSNLHSHLRLPPLAAAPRHLLHHRAHIDFLMSCSVVLAVLPCSASDGSFVYIATSSPGAAIQSFCASEHDEMCSIRQPTACLMSDLSRNNTQLLLAWQLWHQQPCLAADLLDSSRNSQCACFVLHAAAGSDSFAYRLTDCSGNIKTATVTLVYIAPPVAVADRW